jgi:hypothetical protein
MPDGTERDIGLRQVGPGRYVQDLELPSAGPYGVLVQLNSEDGEQEHKEVGYVHPVSAEYAPIADVAQGQQLLRAIAATTGGEEITTEWSAEGNIAAAEDTPEQSTTRSLLDTIKASFSEKVWLWLLGAALFTWVLEIAVRRGLFDRGRS